MPSNPYNPYQDALAGLKQLSAGMIRPNPKTSLLPPEDDVIQTPRWGTGQILSIKSDPSVQRYDILNNLEREQKERLYRAQLGGDPNETAAVQGLLAGTQKDLAESPVSTAFKLNEAGFTSPQQAAEFERGLATQKINAPIEQARISAQADRDVANIGGAGRLMERKMAGQTDVDVAKLKAEEAAKEHQNFLEMLKNQAAGQPGGYRSVTIPGAGSVSFAPEPNFNTAILNKLATAQKGAADTPSAGTENELQQAIRNAFSADPAPGLIKAGVMEILQDPRSKGRSIDDLVNIAGGGQTSPEDKVHIRRLLSYYLNAR